jgi:hypothetical protein
LQGVRSRRGGYRRLGLVPLLPFGLLPCAPSLRGVREMRDGAPLVRHRLRLSPRLCSDGNDALFSHVLLSQGVALLLDLL